MTPTRRYLFRLNPFWHTLIFGIDDTPLLFFYTVHVHFDRLRSFNALFCPHQFDTVVKVSIKCKKIWKDGLCIQSLVYYSNFKSVVESYVKMKQIEFTNHFKTYVKNVLKVYKEERDST